MPKPRAYHIRPVLAGQSLAQALRHLLRDRTWTDIKKLISGRRVQINGNLCVDEGRRLKAGDVVHVHAESLARPPQGEDLKILYADADLLVCDKPAGVTTLRHAEERDWPDRRKQKQPTLDELLSQRLGSLPAGATRVRNGSALPIIRRGRQAARVRAVHRLDRDTSGLMIFALSPESEQVLVAAFKDHSIQRVYQAVVHGNPGERTIDTHFIRDRGDGLRGSTPRGGDDPEARRAVTHVRTIERIGPYSLVECRLETGRTHQIRIHLSEIGHMLCGERTYVRPAAGAAPVIDRSGAPRQALHSAELHFVHPLTGKNLSFAAPPPPDLSRWLAGLRRTVVPGQA